MATPRRLFRAVVERNEPEGEAGAYRRIAYRLDAALEFGAGQFAMVRGDWAADPLLGRPMSILAAGGAGGAGGAQAEFLVKVTGKGTTLLGDARPGSRATLLAPLGRPFEAAAGRALLVGGGVGVPPVFALARELARAGRAAEATVFVGGRAAGDTFPALRAEIAALGVDVVTATEDGSTGVHGRVTAPLAERLRDARATAARSGGQGPTVYACGPEGMLRAVGALVRDAGGAVRYQAAVEQLMGCGFGACLGCILDGADGRRRLVCTDGPVLDGRAVYG